MDSLSKIQKELTYQNRLSDKLEKFKDDFNRSGDEDALIRGYEAVFVKAKPPLVSSQVFDLVSLYKKHGRYDEASKLLGQLYLRQGANKARIQKELDRIVKMQERDAKKKASRS